jgi:hypothetical protein
VPEILELAELAEWHGMTQMQVGRGRIDAQLRAKRASSLELLGEIGERNYVRGAARDDVQLLGHG